MAGLNTCPGHPRLSFSSAAKAWMPGSSPGMTSMFASTGVSVQRALSPFLDESEKHLKRHRRLSTAGVIEENAGQRAAPAFQQRDQPALRDVWFNHRLREIGNADAVEGCAQQEFESIAGQRAFDGDLGTRAALVQN